MRWTEEIMLVQEEMRQVSLYLSWYKNWWSSHADVGCMREYDPFLLEGITAYAERQAHLRASLQGQFQELWTDVAAWVTGQKVVDGGGRDAEDDNDDNND